jgi:hypothetical protein
VLTEDGVLHTATRRNFLMSILTQILKFFLRLSHCASVGEKTLIIIKIHGMYVEKYCTLCKLKNLEVVE